MAKATRLAKPRPINKRGQRPDIYSDENGNVFGDNKGSERNFSLKSKSNDPDVASLQTMRYYFDDEWFDNDRYYIDYKQSKSFVHTIRSRGDAITPQRCTECKKAFQRVVRNSANKPSFAYLNQELFGNMPLEDGVCPNCE
tara:strand:+ start:87 stop:509 length:423 start_codon:yes stop_codon:yes gene_type:complete